MNGYDLTEAGAKELYDELLLIRRQIRNFVAHGAFGKEGEAFSFHSSVGAVPVLLRDDARHRHFSIFGEEPFTDPAAFGVIDRFIGFLWTGIRGNARAYIQDTTLPAILTMAIDGTYGTALASATAMERLLDRLSYESDTAANMDW